MSQRLRKKIQEKTRPKILLVKTMRRVKRATIIWTKIQLILLTMATILRLQMKVMLMEQALMKMQRLKTKQLILLRLITMMKTKRLQMKEMTLVQLVRQRRLTQTQLTVQVTKKTRKTQTMGKMLTEIMRPLQMTNLLLSLAPKKQMTKQEIATLKVMALKQQLMKSLTQTTQKTAQRLVQIKRTQIRMVTQLLIKMKELMMKSKKINLQLIIQTPKSMMILIQTELPTMVTPIQKKTMLPSTIRRNSSLKTKLKVKLILLIK